MNTGAILQLESQSTFLLNPVTDKGSRAKDDVSFWTPQPIQGFSWLGMFAVPNYNPAPSGATFLEKSAGAYSRPLLAPPVGFNQVWTCVGDGQPSNLGIYSLQAPPGYIGLGTIAVPDFNSPPMLGNYPNLMCVRQDLCKQVSVSTVVWNDQGSGAPLDVTVFMLPTAQIAAAFVANGYPGSATVWDLDPDKVAYVGDLQSEEAV
ncbi:Vps62-related protein [uncultured Caulobacter sp.]|uniref:Vps62-related protein n=1 Tax=uncultured Caulobacter sp. TaxID=158749 RepID=UPI002639DB57|nr:Vps62-related protein [uncultured Caulobacter sp.]